MNINVRTHHVDITKALKDYALKKMEKLEKYFDNIVDVDVELDISASSAEDARQIVSVIVKVPGNTIRATEASRDMYASIDMVFDKLGVQLKKHKDKLKDHKKDGAKRSISPGKIKYAQNAEPNIEAKLYVPKPMDVEDAAAILAESSYPFFVFRNIRTEEINVIYRLKKSDGLGLIEP